MWSSAVTDYNTNVQKEKLQQSLVMSCEQDDFVKSSEPVVLRWTIWFSLTPYISNQHLSNLG